MKVLWKVTLCDGIHVHEDYTLHPLRVGDYYFFCRVKHTWRKCGWKGRL